MFKEQELQQKNGMSAAITIKDWIFLMLISLLNLIPFVGFIVYLVLYIVIGFSKDTAVSISNYIKANLVVAAIIMVVSIILIFVLGISIGPLANVIR